MIWQDVILMVGGFGFALALIPAVRAKNKPPRLTCLATGCLLLAFVVCYATLGLWLAAQSGALTALLWFVLLLQRR